MVSQLRYSTFSTKMGWLGILGSARGLLAITLPQHSSEQAIKLLALGSKQAIWSPEHFDDLTARLRGYLDGDKVAFTDKLDLSAATQFQRQVWQTTRLIPYGETRSYQWLAQALGRPEAARAVGQALARNRLPIIIPCHRVVGSDGKLGGYSGGIEMKRRLLNLEASTSNKKGSNLY